eukprot:TRINITY_DN15685_c0_g1_i1.p2 TRINITY_DN15685_c0_g1~~TRINITY_DN15685_c0_g1_i1.p2  ORF type:complete len:162 (+),score=54.18 TRINITY_DN15685_c0_g1_i1:61-546(+)
MSRFQKHKFPMKSTRKYDHLDADAPLYTDRARKRQKRDEQAPKLDEAAIHDPEGTARRFFEYLDRRDIDSLLGMASDTLLWSTPTATYQGKGAVREALAKPPKAGLVASWGRGLGLLKTGDYARSGTIQPRPSADAFAAEQIVSFDDGRVHKFVEQRKSGY